MFRLLMLKPPHGWSAVGWELAIVTVGVLIALAAQQMVSWLTDRRTAVRAIGGIGGSELAVHPTALLLETQELAQSFDVDCSDHGGIQFILWKDLRGRNLREKCIGRSTRTAGGTLGRSVLELRSGRRG